MSNLAIKSKSIRQIPYGRCFCLIKKRPSDLTISQTDGLVDLLYLDSHFRRTIVSSSGVSLVTC